MNRIEEINIRLAELERAKHVQDISDYELSVIEKEARYLINEIDKLEEPTEEEYQQEAQERLDDVNSANQD